MAPPNLSNGIDEGSSPRADVRAHMIAYIKKHFSELLGTDAALLDAPGGLDALAQKFHSKFWRQA
jgi:hypothetical protein